MNRNDRDDNNQSAQFSLSDLRTIQGLARENPEILTESTLRWQARHRDENGLGKFCVAVGRNLLISKSGYESWLAEQAGKTIPRRRRGG